MTRPDEQTQLERALHAIRQMRERLDAVEQARHEAIAVTGLSCRFPGADSPEAFWELLRDGVDAISEVPDGRWDGNGMYDPDSEAPGKLATRWGGFLSSVDGFDPQFFGISPREAAAMDPQQRLLLEVAYEALEGAGLTLEWLRRSRTGVFVGAHSHSNSYEVLQTRSLEDIGTYTSTGTAHSILANRISYLFDLRGPSLTVDTACSSSLASVHLACRSLRSRECDAAIAGGVNLMLTPETTVMESRMRMMAGDGRCKSFDSRADGFVRGEGCGLVVLRRLSDAIAAGDPILAVIAGSAMNQDGTTNGLTAPNGLSQREVIRQALADARADAATVSFVETHGTGTALGDPIEVEALADVLGSGDRPCLLGAVKSNIGHLEGAAGIAGLIKVVLSLVHETIPPNLHFRTLNPHISLGGTRLEIPQSPRSWTGAQRLAGVSSFGFGGTNVHLIVGAPPSMTTPALAEEVSSSFALPISARSSSALGQIAAAFASHVEESSDSLTDICHTAGARRTHHTHRMVAVALSREGLVRGMLDVGSQDFPVQVATGRVEEDRQRSLIYVLGQIDRDTVVGARSLAQRFAAFRRALQECAGCLAGTRAGRGLEMLLSPDVQVEELGSGPVLTFGIQVAFAALWRSWGIAPDAVVGDAAGEIASAYLGGSLTLQKAARVAAALERGNDGAELREALAGPQAEAARTRAFATSTSAQVRVFGSEHWRRWNGLPGDVHAAIALARTTRDVDCLWIGASDAKRSSFTDSRTNHIGLSPTVGAPPEYALHCAAAELYVRGYQLDWSAIAPAGRVVSLPRYPWQRERYWITSGAVPASSVPDSIGSPYSLRRISSPVLRATAFEGALDAEIVSSLGVHEVDGVPVLAGSAIIGLFLAACRARGTLATSVEDLRINLPLPLDKGSRRVVQVVLDGPAASSSAELYSRREDDAAEWTLHARALVRSGAVAVPMVWVDRPVVTNDSSAHLDSAVAYIRDLRQGEDDRLPTRLLDDCFRALARFVHENNGRAPRVLGSVTALRRHSAQLTGEGLSCRMRIEAASTADAALTGHFILADSSGQSIAEVEGARFVVVQGQPTTAEEQVADSTTEIEYDVAWRARSALNHGAQRSTPDQPGVAALVAAASAEGLSEEQGATSEATRALCDALHSLAAAFAIDALRALGQELVQGSTISWRGLRSQLGSAPHLTWLAQRLLLMLTEDGLLVQSEGTWLVVRDIERRNAAEVIADLNARYPDHAAELALFGRCGSALGDVLSGRTEGIDLLFANASLDEMYRLYADAPLSRSGNLVARSMVEALANALPASRALRILEVGAGTGGTAAHVISALAGRRVEYLFTDVSEVFLDRARERFADQPFVRCDHLDLTNDISNQGVRPGQFDLVIASNVLHATPRLRETVRQVRSLLAPEGTLLLVEGIAPSRWIDIAFGVTPGWWCFADDDLRSTHPLLSVTQWSALLRAEGFADTAAIELPEGSAGRTCGQAVLVARASAEQAEGAGQPLHAPGGPWYILADDGALGRELSVSIRALGGECSLAFAGEEFHRFSHSEQLLDARLPADVASSVNDWASGVKGQGRIVYMWGVDDVCGELSAEDAYVGASRHCANLITICQSLVRVSAPPRIWVVTRNAQPILRSDVVDPGQAALWGLGRSIALEHPELWGGLIDLPADGRDDIGAAQIFDQVCAAQGEQEAAFRHDGRYVPRLTSAAVVRGGAPMLHRSGAYLLSGGLGVLGLRLARWLAQGGAGHVVLLGRTPFPARSVWTALPAESSARRVAAAFEEIEQLGCTVSTVAADVTDRTAMEAIIRRFGDDLPPLRGIFHTAAAISFTPVSRMSPEALDKVMRPKVVGGWLLHELTRSLPLDYFVLYSSVASVWGSRGMAHYAAANQFLDALANHRRALGLPGLSVNWGGWKDGGGSADATRFLEQSDLLPLDPERALNSMGVLMDAGVPQRTVAAVRWNRMKAAFAFAGGGRLLDEIRAQPVSPHEPVEQVQRTDAGFVSELRALSRAQARERLTTHVREQVANVLALPVDRLMEASLGFFRLGMDSLMTVDLRSRLERSLGLRLPSTIAFEYPTVESLGAQLAERLFADDVRNALPAPNSEATNGGSGATLPPLAEEELARLLDLAITETLEGGGRRR
jgi:microcystin synthetase protein McyD